jgi:(1->4)-alpha-D-glucan 1-alpha-D-glucosylmutase
MIPRATYRMQFHKHFTFADAARQVEYLAALGISHLYASPILAARAGSLHGYDVIDHGRINPELGGEEGLRALAGTLKAHGMGMIVDIVPNHMAVGQADNGWWQDVLRHGPASRFAAAFDIDWDAPGHDGKILAPFLDGEARTLWEKADLKLLREDGQWAFAYFGHRFPLRPEDQGLKDAPAAWPAIRVLLDRQHYILADWRDAGRRINWRRFFDITELAALRVMEPWVFEAVHALVFDLYAQGLIDGVRVDHIDGLADPAAYCRQLRRRLTALRPGAYIVVEKILAKAETLPADWQVDGTTGYDAMNDIAALLHGDDGGALETLWQQTSGRHFSFEQEEIQARRELLSSGFASQCDAAGRAFARLPAAGPPDREVQDTIVSLRCYRGYATGKPRSPGPGPILSHALDQGPGLRPWFDDRSGDPAVIDALRRFHQLSAPVAAKAVEDTAFYRYGRLLSRNDVGFDPRTHFLSIADFHARTLRRAADFPHAMLATATHDHKRGEDMRARLAVLSTHVDLWQGFLRQAPAAAAVHPADAYILYQTLVGSWPESPDGDYAQRIEGWCRKHLREAGLRSSWRDPDTTYEAQFCAFARRLIRDDPRFGACITRLLHAIAPQAQVNSLVQVALRHTLPGVPDLYQGCEFTDLSLVDPDNRRPVDYAARARALKTAPTPDAPLDHRKQKLIALLLAARTQMPELWQAGDYQPLPAPPGVVAFRRRHKTHSVSILLGCIANGQGTVPLAGTYRDLLSDRILGPGDISLPDLFDRWPAVILLENG